MVRKNAIHRPAIREKIRNPFASRRKNVSEEIDVPDISMYEMVKRSASKHPGAPAFNYLGRVCSYAELIRKIDSCASAYANAGVSAGDTVTICMPNTPEAVISVYAVNKLGGICNIIHPLSAQEEIKRDVNSVGSKVILTIDICLKKIRAVIDETCLKTVVVVSAGDSMPTALRLAYSIANKPKEKLNFRDSRFVLWNVFFHSSTTAVPPALYSNDLPSVILHSGGTTGTPKEIVLSNRNFNAFGVQSVTTLTNVGVGDSILAILPIFHGFGVGVCVHAAFCFGACSVLIPKFDSRKFASLLRKYRPTVIFGVPTLFEALSSASHTDKLDLSFIKYAISGGDSLSVSLENRINEFFASHKANVKVCQGYGMTECLAAASLAVNECSKSQSIGKPLKGNKFCIVRPGTQTPLPPNTDGEICISGPTVMLGYRNNEKETNEALRIHSDGRIWLHTGDIGCIDENGYVYYRSRLKRLIISSGYNVYPQHVESVIEEHPAVLNCTVTAIPHPYKIEVAKAFIVLRDGFEPSEQLKLSIKDHCAKNLAKYALPYEYEFRTSLPKTAMGKTDYKALMAGNGKEK